MEWLALMTVIDRLYLHETARPVFDPRPGIFAGEQIVRPSNLAYLFGERAGFS